LLEFNDFFIFWCEMHFGRIRRFCLNSMHLDGLLNLCLNSVHLGGICRCLMKSSQNASGAHLIQQSRQNARVEQFIFENPARMREWSTCYRIIKPERESGAHLNEGPAIDGVGTGA
jgi:hypothetical protein